MLRPLNYLLRGWIQGLVRFCDPQGHARVVLGRMADLGSGCIAALADLSSGRWFDRPGIFLVASPACDLDIVIDFPDPGYLGTRWVTISGRVAGWSSRHRHLVLRSGDGSVLSAVMLDPHQQSTSVVPLAGRPALTWTVAVLAPRGLSYWHLEYEQAGVRHRLARLHLKTPYGCFAGDPATSTGTLLTAAQIAALVARTSHPHRFPVVLQIRLGAGGADWFHALADDLRRQTCAGWRLVVAVPQGSSSRSLAAAVAESDPRFEIQDETTSIAYSDHGLVMLAHGCRLLPQAVACFYTTLEDLPGGVCVLVPEARAFLVPASSRARISDATPRWLEIPTSVPLVLAMRQCTMHADASGLLRQVVQFQSEGPARDHEERDLALDILGSSIAAAGVSVSLHSSTEGIAVRPSDGREPQVSLMLLLPMPQPRLDERLERLIRATSYPHLQVLVAAPEAIHALLPDSVAGIQIMRIRSAQEPWSYSRMVNSMNTLVTSDFVLFMTGVAEVESPSWLANLVGVAMLPGVGSVSPACEPIEPAERQLTEVPSSFNQPTVAAGMDPRCWMIARDRLGQGLNEAYRSHAAAAALAADLSRDGLQHLLECGTLIKLECSSEHGTRIVQTGGEAHDQQGQVGNLAGSGPVTGRDILEDAIVKNAQALRS